jgi:hypothetical protein
MISLDCHPRNSYGYAIGEVASSLPFGGNLLENLDLTLPENSRDENV